MSVGDSVQDAVEAGVCVGNQNREDVHFLGIGVVLVQNNLRNKNRELLLNSSAA